MSDQISVVKELQGLRVERVVTSGTFALDGGQWDVDNNVWLIGDDSDVVIVDAAHDARPIIDAVAGRNVTACCAHTDTMTTSVSPRNWVVS